MTHTVLAHKLTAQEVRDLEDLVSHPGWKLLEIYVDEEWGAVGFGQKIANTIGNITPEATNLAVQHLQQATCVQREVLRIMKWPRATVNEAKSLARGQVASMNRGGL